MSLRKVRVAVFPGLGLDRYSLVEIEDDDAFADKLASTLAAPRVRSEFVSPVHTLYRGVDGDARRAEWFVLVREHPTTGRLVDVAADDVRELPRMLAAASKK